jgi:hypothetical protein
MPLVESLKLLLQEMRFVLFIFYFFFISFVICRKFFDGKFIYFSIIEQVENFPQHKLFS